jgi:hypothetical protein
LECSPADLLICEPEKVAARREQAARAAGGGGEAAPPPVRPRLGRNRSKPPA